jgi:hypothetical protein
MQATIYRHNSSPCAAANGFARPLPPPLDRPVPSSHSKLAVIHVLCIG